MNQPTSLYLASLLEVEWQKPEEFEFPNEFAKHWLEEQGSLSRRLKQHCQELTVELLQNHIITAKTLKSDESQLLSEQDCLLREVVLCGDDCPWVVGRTLIPRTTLVDQQYDLAQQGDIPLGLTVFSADNVERDSLQMGWVHLPQGRFLARRSRLWMNRKPMLVAELFLSNSPIYAKERG
ncbi:chorismate lyase [Vibrio parahaemolyticus]|uniref:chorismate lyase n=1 Tax=Vibrio parahaemolyticus TaxID=670 RepID=UPI0014303759|nr:chorismate lyase [Vibrio parahaemolyticus]EHY0996430.1 chorismate lyase [Vibrio parahaemolyticus]EJC6803253.1 chorismate lyase [Vibrio parahaemolyticus]EJG0273863.1 chorismate lyase [Vibrio parahaemolyticus]EJG1197115.1 chorismate lyase [Vibrio parahaemolyticus]EJG2166646.1 chorismate lyase [Vibrio parahaemolyticus]